METLNEFLKGGTKEAALKAHLVIGGMESTFLAQFVDIKELITYVKVLIAFADQHEDTIPKRWRCVSPSCQRDISPFCQGEISMDKTSMEFCPYYIGTEA